MKFSAREDISAPIEEVFALISDFDRLERAALRRGADIVRVDRLPLPGPGMAWTAEFSFRGKLRRVETELITWQPPESLAAHSTVAGLLGVSTIDLVRLSPRQTRVAVAVELRPQTIAARMLLQTLRLAKGQLSERFKSGVARYAREIEAGNFRRPDPS